MNILLGVLLLARVMVLLLLALSLPLLGVLGLGLVLMLAWIKEGEVCRQRTVGRATGVERMVLMDSGDVRMRSRSVEEISQLGLDAIVEGVCQRRERQRVCPRMGASVKASGRRRRAVLCLSATVKVFGLSKARSNLLRALER
jgi:hypothetical protein